MLIHIPVIAFLWHRMARERPRPPTVIAGPSPVSVSDATAESAHDIAVRAERDRIYGVGLAISLP
jgi:hypothetical protein